jgi:hypothetical protein
MLEDSSIFDTKSGYFPDNVFLVDTANFLREMEKRNVIANADELISQLQMPPGQRDFKSLSGEISKTHLTLEQSKAQAERMLKFYTDQLLKMNIIRFEGQKIQISEDYMGNIGVRGFLAAANELKIGHKQDVNYCFVPSSDFQKLVEDARKIDPDKRKEAVRLFSERKLDDYSAMVRAGINTYRELLEALGEYGFSYPALPEEDLEEQSELVSYILKTNRDEKIMVENSNPKGSVIVVLDVGTFISLAKIDRLELLLALKMPVKTIDAVYYEIVVDPEKYYSDRKIRDFVKKHTRLEYTNQGEFSLEQKARGINTKGMHLGEMGIFEFLNTRVNALADEAENVFVLLEDHKMFSGQQKLFPANVHFLSTIGFLKGFEKQNVIQSSNELVEQLLSRQKQWFE